jgi:citrate lyase subunit beta/citryl-CoA lyase
MAWVPARAYGIDIIDGVYNGIDKAEGFARECGDDARDMGFDAGRSFTPPRSKNRTFTVTDRRLHCCLGQRSEPRSIGGT